MIKKNLNWNKTAIVLVNYNGEDVLEECIKSLIQKDEKDIEIVVVDNGSQDSSMEYIENYYPCVHTIYMERNVGWGAGSNVGLQISFENGAQYALLLNTDTEIEEDTISELLNYCDDNTLAIPRIYRDKDDKDNSLWYSGGEIDFETAEVRQTLFKYDSDDSACDIPRKVEFATGCCMMISKKIWDKVGGFDEEYFLYYEDVDYCMRLKEHGIGIMYVPKTAIWHKVGGSAGGEISNISQYYTVRNRLFFADRYKNYMKTDVMGILKKIMEARTYFTTPFDRKYQKVVLAGIKDYMRGVRGREENFLNENFTVIGGFYETEIDECERRWLWCRENVAEIEVHNIYKERKIYELLGEICIAEGVDRELVEVYRNEEYYCNIDTSQRKFCIQMIIGAGEKVRIKFAVKGIEHEDENSRVSRHAFGIANMRMKIKKFDGYALGSGAYETERDGENTWNWISNQNFLMYLMNENEQEREVLLSFTLSKAPTHDSLHVTVMEEKSIIVNRLKECEYQLHFNLKPHEKKLLRFNTNEEPVEGFQGDSRRLFYEIRNIRLNFL